MTQFRSNYDLLIWVLGCFSFVLVFQVLDQGLTKSTFWGVLFVSILILFFWLVRRNTYLLVEDDGFVTSKVFIDRGFRLKISCISKVERINAFVFKNWGCQMVVDYVDEDGCERTSSVTESCYDVEVIKSFLFLLKQLNPSIHLHPQYQDLIDGKIKDEDNFKKMRLTESV